MTMTFETAPTDVGGEIDLQKYWQTFLRWWWLIVACTVLAAGSAYVISSRMTPVYSATATLLVQQAPATSVADYTALLTSERLASTYAEMLTARPVLEETQRRLGLSSLPDSVSVSVVRDTQLLSLNAESTDPELAAMIANTVAEVFVDQNRQLQEERYAASLSNIEKQLQELPVKIEETQRELLALGSANDSESLAERARLETALTSYRNTYSALLGSYEQMRLSAIQSSNTLTIFDPASAPVAPVRPNKLQNTALAGVVGALLALGVVFLIEYLDDTLKNSEDVSRVLGLSTLGAIGQLGKESDELITAHHPLASVSEDFRVLRTNLRFAGVDKALRTILVTSPAPSEGKTVTAANLAVVLAQSGLRVALVDADLRRPRQHHLFNIPSGAEGVTESLVEGKTDGRITQPLADFDLRLLPAGALPPNPVEMVGSQRMRQLLEGLASEADVVVVDSPPVLSMADAAVLAQAVDGVLLAVEANKTRRGAAQDAVLSLQQIGANVLGVVLTQVPQRNSRYYYYYREYYDADGEKKRVRGKRRHSRAPRD
ncbi:MAG: Tyrosine-protein kinase YwqD [Chloroflexi bacterium ADurb.Bin222]|nr:MAG: Tyrosine-protein kinase YwqD [Chloroflexi bacterium ADurb.Bin222]